MALSGTVKTNSYNGRCYQLDWTATQSIESNTSKVSWTLKMKGSNNGEWWMEHSLQLAMYGEYRINRDTSVKRYVGVIDTGEFTVEHDDQGDASFSVSIEAALYSYSVSCTAEQTTFSLNQIPRKATLLTAPNFSDETREIVITYSNPAGSSVDALEACIALAENQSDIEYRAVSKTSGTYTFVLSDDEKNLLINSISSGVSRTVYFYIRTKIGSSVYYHNLSRTFTIDNAMPIVTTQITDSNTVQTLPLTGSHNTFIKYFSKPSVTVVATAQKGASIIEKTISNSGTSKTSTKTNFVFDTMESADFITTVTDSRNNTTIVNDTVNLIEYFLPTCELSLDAPTTAGDTTLKVSGQFFSGDFGASYNKILGVQYQYTSKEGSSGWIDANLDDCVTSGDEFMIDIDVGGLNYKLVYTFQIKVRDRLIAVQSAEQTVKTTPVFDWGEDDFNFNVPVTITEEDVCYNLLGALKAMTTSYTLNVSAISSTNYTSASGSAVLAGNTLRVYFQATRSSAPTVGNITDEQMCQLSITHNGKIKDIFNIGFINGNAGAIASFHTSDMSINNNTVTIKLFLASTTATSTNFSGYFSIPVIIDLDKY